MFRYITVGRDSEYTTHVIRLDKEGNKTQIIATFNSWRNATRYANALNFPNSK